MAKARGPASDDPTLRRVELDNVGPAVLADTVGFIAHLPHKLVEAFKATLEETLNADLLLHVIDAASDERDDNMFQVGMSVSPGYFCAAINSDCFVVDAQDTTWGTLKSMYR